MRLATRRTAPPRARGPGRRRRGRNSRLLTALRSRTSLILLCRFLAGGGPPDATVRARRWSGLASCDGLAPGGLHSVAEAQGSGWRLSRGSGGFARGPRSRGSYRPRHSSRGRSHGACVPVWVVGSAEVGSDQDHILSVGEPSMGSVRRRPVLTPVVVSMLISTPASHDDTVVVPRVMRYTATSSNTPSRPTHHRHCGRGVGKLRHD
jgi:hypothetical protein